MRPAPMCPTSSDTQVLIQAVRRGGTQAWGELFERYRPMLALLARARLGERERRRFDTEDVLAQAFASAAADIERFEYRGEGSFRAWLTALVTARARDLVRFHGRERRDARREQALDVAPLAEPTAAGPATLAEIAERDARLLDALSELAPDDQQLISMRNVEEQTWEQIAGVIGCGVGAARGRYARALESLARAMGGEPSADSRTNDAGSSGERGRRP